MGLSPCKSVCCQRLSTLDAPTSAAPMQTDSITPPTAAPSGDENVVQVGMPQLGFNGLNENWLLKECGHRHWMAICDAAGVRSHEITDSQGHRLYAAFVAIELDGDPLSRFGENDSMRFRTHLTRFSSKRFFSQIQLRSAKGSGLAVNMVSIFVRKPVFDDNRSISGGHPDPLRRVPQSDAPARAGELLDAWKTAKNLGPPREGPRYAHSICPTTDFNGARLLYFANFQHILDAAEWSALDTRDMQFASTTHRRFYFYGNVNYSDVLDIRFSDVDWSGTARSHRASFRRHADGALLAVIETGKRIDPPEARRRI